MRVWVLTGDKLETAVDIGCRRGREAKGTTEMFKCRDPRYLRYSSRRLYFGVLHALQVLSELALLPAALRRSSGGFHRYSCELLTKDMHVEILQNITSLENMREELTRIAQSRPGPPVCSCLLRGTPLRYEYN